MITKLLNYLFKPNEYIDTKHKMNTNTKYTYISFDASVGEDGSLGIGMYDITNKESKHSSGSLRKLNSYKGEVKALKFSLEYAHNNNIKNLILYTDNLVLASKDISKYTKEYNFESVLITWIPRELNNEADRLSKIGRLVDFPSNSVSLAINKHQKKSFNMFSKYTVEEKIKIVKTLHNKDCEYERQLISILDACEPTNGLEIPREKSVLYSMAKNILGLDRKAHINHRDLFKKITYKEDNKKLNTLSFKDFEEEFDRRYQYIKDING